jgi:hypothetical protein
MPELLVVASKMWQMNEPAYNALAAAAALYRPNLRDEADHHVIELAIAAGANGRGQGFSARAYN